MKVLLTTNFELGLGKILHNCTNKNTGFYQEINLSENPFAVSEKWVDEWMKLVSERLRKDEVDVYNIGRS